MKLHRLPGYIQTIYLVEYPHGLLLLDGCARADTNMLAHFIVHTLQRPMSDLKLIVVTHMHPDHAGAAVQLKKLSGCDIAVANSPGQWYQGFTGFIMHLTDVLLLHWVAKRKGKKCQFSWYHRFIKGDYFMADQQLLPHFSEWQVLHTPGHTDRDLSLLHLPSKTLYIADLLVEVKQKLVAPYPIFYPKLYQASLAKILAVDAQKWLLAHHSEVNPKSLNQNALFNMVPKTPTTHWRSVKAKLLTIIRGEKKE